MVQLSKLQADTVFAICTRDDGDHEKPIVLLGMCKGNANQSG